MGNQCLSTTPNQKYSKYLSQIKVAELKDLWQTVKVYKIKKLYDGSSIPHQQYKTHTYLTFQGFRKLFPDLANYPDQQIHRLYDIFDLLELFFFYNNDMLLWFIEDVGIDNVHDVRPHSRYGVRQLLLKADVDNSSGVEYQVDEILEQLSTQEGLTIQNWLKVANKYIDFGSFRKLFNIFVEEKMEKELVRDFYDWNVIYDEEKEKYVGYLINLKWFQTWRLYIFQHYNVNIDIYNPIKQTIRSIKTCKKTIKIGSSKKIGVDSSRALHGCRIVDVPNRQKSQDHRLKDIDCVHSHLGERPREIANTQLQGQFEQVLRGGVSQNMDYIVVSEKVWNYLKTIYDGYPEFRRTGFDAIELYPKIVRVYFSLFKGHIDYSTEVIREVSSYLRVDHLLSRSCEVPENQISNKVIYFKTIGMSKWQQLQDSSFIFTELTPDLLIFLVCLPNEEKQTFKKNHQKAPRDVTEVNLGDKLIYTTSSNQDREVIFLGKSTQGKYILHFEGLSYTQDLCLLQSELIKQCKLSARLQSIVPEKRSHCDLVGLPSGPGLGFINSLFVHLFNSKQLKNQMLISDCSKSQKLYYSLARIFDLLNKQGRIQAMDIKQVIDLYLSKYTDFEVGMCCNFVNQVFGQLARQLKQEQLPNIISTKFQVQMERKVVCQNCKTKTSNCQKQYVLKVPIPQQKHLYFEVVWVPTQFKSSEILRYLIKIKKQATLAQFMVTLEQDMNIKDRPYILAQVYGNDIVKNYHTATRTATLQTLKMRSNDKLYAFELITDLNTFVYNHFNNRQILQEEQIHKDQFIDCKHSERGWIFGKVIQIQYLPYTQSTIVKVLHKFNKNQSWQISYDVFEGSVARFPIKSYKNCEQYHLRVQQRYFNEAANSMQLITMPLVIVLPAWMRWKQFFYFVYLHMRRFIGDTYSLPAQYLQQKSQRKPTRKGDKSKTDKFKQYKNSSQFPYSLRLADYQGRCAVCFKFLKSTVFKGQNDLYCQGCQLSQYQPISWQVKPADLMVCIDWHSADSFKTDIIENSPSHKQMTAELINQQQTLQHCLSLMKQSHTTKQQSLCCNTISDKVNNDRLVSTSENVLIYLQRVVEQSDGFKKVVNRPIKIELQGVKIGQLRYNLIGMTSIEGEHHNIRYKTYTNKCKNQWYEYDGSLVRIVDSNYIDKVTAFMLYYQKSSK